MTVVSTYFRWDLATEWCSSAAATTEPWYIINTQLSNFCTAVGTDKIAITLNPAQNTTLNSATNVSWLLSFPETSNHMQFGLRPGDSASAAPSYSYYWVWGRTPGTANNGLGTFADTAVSTSTGFQITSPTASNRVMGLILYEADVAQPWWYFGYWDINTTGSGLRGVGFYRMDQSAAAVGASNPIPANTSPWAFLHHSSSTILWGQSVAVRNLGVHGTTNTFITANYWQTELEAMMCPTFQYPGTFYKPTVIWGQRYPMGKLPADCMLVGTANYGSTLETITFEGKKYTKVTNSSSARSLWVRIE